MEEDLFSPDGEEEWHTSFRHLVVEVNSGHPIALFQ
jgi:hypothetical protein